MKDLILYLASTFIFCIFLPSITFAQSLNPEGLVQIPLLEVAPVQPQGEGCGKIEIAHTTSQSIGELGIGCNNIPPGRLLSENSFYWAFELNSFDIFGDFEICAVEIGILFATSNSGSQPLTINLYTSNPAFPDGVLTQIGTTSIQLSDQIETIETIPIGETAPAGSELVVEIFVPEGRQAAGNRFAIGTNNFPATGTSHIRAPDCGASTPTPLTDFGLDVHYVIKLIGNEKVNISPIPTLSEWGLIAMAGILGIVGFMVIRRRKVTV